MLQELKGIKARGGEVKELEIEKIKPCTVLERQLVARLKKAELEKEKLKHDGARLLQELKGIKARGGLTVSELVGKAHANARAKGFWPGIDWLEYVPPANARAKGFWSGIDWLEYVPPAEVAVVESAMTCQALLLIVTEIAEATEELRKGNREGFEEELADTWIRLGDLCGGLGIDIELAIRKKMAYNKNRERRHGKLF